MGTTPASSWQPLHIVDPFVVRDVSLAAQSQAFGPAFEVDAELDRVASILEAGKAPVVVGPSGVGRSAVIQELVRRHAVGEAVPALEGKRVLECSFARGVARITARGDGPGGFDAIVRALAAALAECADDVLPWFSDLDFLPRGEVQSVFRAMVSNRVRTFLAEGTAERIAWAVGRAPCLAQQVVFVPMQEPDRKKTTRILLSWAESRNLSFGGTASDEEAVGAAIDLTDRFLPHARLPRKAIELLEATRAAKGSATRIEPSAVRERFRRIHGLPEGLLAPFSTLDAGKVKQAFEKEILGQPEAVQAMVRAVASCRGRLEAPQRPLAVLLFLGPPGVGKTHAARTLAEYVFGSRERLVRIPLADYSAEEDAEALFGASRGDGTTGELARGLLLQPPGVLLLAEFEKAHPSIRERLFQLLDEGRFMTGPGAVLSCRSWVIIATSCAGTEPYRKTFARAGGRPAGQAGLDQAVERGFARHFRADPLDHFDQVVHFHALSRDDVRKIAYREVIRFIEHPRSVRSSCKIQCFDDVLDWLVARGHDPEHGVRRLRRVVERHVGTALAPVLLQKPECSGLRLRLAVRHNRLVVEAGERRVSDTPWDRDVLVLPGPRGRRHVDDHLIAEADRVLHDAALRLDAFRRLQDQAAELAEQIDREGLWREPGDPGGLVARYRDLDVLIQCGERMAASWHELGAVRQKFPKGGDWKTLVERTKAADRAIRRWDERLADSGAGAVWVFLHKVEPLLPATRWLNDLTAMELAWCGNLKLRAEVVAGNDVDGELSRVVLAVEGPGTDAALGMEHGVHKRVRRQASDLHVRVDVIPRSVRPASPLPPTQRIKPRLGPMGVEFIAHGRVEVARLGTVVELLGVDEQVLGHLMADYRAFFSSHPVPREEARVYGPDGSGVRDPRTEAVVDRLQTVMSGDLQPLLDAWRARQGTVE